MYIIMLGAPGSGKGTHGGRLAEKLGLAHISTGDLLRAILADENHPLYNDVKIIKEGKLVTDEIVNNVVKDAINNPKYAAGIIFDGYPRTVGQAEALTAMLAECGKKVDLIADLDVAMDVLLHRLLGRTGCPVCKAIYHKDQGYTECPKCHVPLVVRDDDNEETVRARFDEYQLKTAPVREYYMQPGKCDKFITEHVTTWENPVEVVFANFCNTLRKGGVEIPD